MPTDRELELTSTANPRIRRLVALRRRRQRDAAGVTLVEGYEELTLALSAGARPAVLYYCPELAEAAGPDEPAGTVARAAAAGAEVVRLTRPVFAKAAYRESPDGWLAELPAPATDLAALRPGPAPLLLACEAVEKPGNLGAMLRTADAAGADAVLAADPVTDWANPNLVRASKGTVFSVPVASAGGAELVDWLRARSVRIVVTTPDTDLAHTDADLTGPAAVVVGAEKHGLSRTFLDAADVRVRIPMHGAANSLNVATSAAIVLYEAVRQRHA